jgi:hypothetical protein
MRRAAVLLRGVRCAGRSTVLYIRVLYGAIIILAQTSPSSAMFLRLYIAVAPVVLRAGAKLLYEAGGHGPKGA